jgi:N12 class adenine-specific DNA methylase
MGRKAHRQSAAASSWLPGFEPDGFESAHLGPGQMLIDPVSASPPSPPTPVAVAAAISTFAAFGQLGSNSLSVATKDALEITQSPALQELQEPTIASPAVDDMAEPGQPWPDFDWTRIAPPSGTNARIEANLNAIRLLKQLERDTIDPTEDQRHQLLGYIGWGGLAKVFERIERNTLAEYQKQLESLLTPEEFASARASTPNAHYTDPVIVKAMWAMVQRLGFKGGRVIEPAAGTGLFLAGMPASVAARSDITAVEMDKVSGAILRAAFNSLGVTTHVSAIEKADVPHGFYDLAISNVPFGDHKSLDSRKAGYSSWSIHNYFFGKAIDLVRPGGLIVFITSRHTLDSASANHRKWLDAHGELIGAVRLPRNAFKKQANTEVVTDIVILRKRESPVFSKPGNWIERAQAPLDMLRPGQDLTYWSAAMRRTVEHDRAINAWYVDRPGLVIGLLELVSNQYGKELQPVFSGTSDEFEERLASCTAELPTDIYKEAKKTGTGLVPTESLLLRRISATHKVKPGSFVEHRGTLCISEGNSWIDVDAAYKGVTRERIFGLMKVRDAARKLLEQQATSSDEAEFKSLQYALNSYYDAFVAKFGYVSDRANVRVFRTDPECPLVLSLESYDEDSEKYVKADIFSKRTAGRKDVPETAETTKDAMLISLALHGRIVVPDMAKRLRVTSTEVVRALGDEALAYVDPEDRSWRPADEYLSGNIRNKISAARAAGKKFEANVAALTQVLPKDLGPGEVEVRLGAPWVPIDVIEQFGDELIEDKAGSFKVLYDAQSATWSIKTAAYRAEYAGKAVLNTGKWGTPKRCAVELIEAALNQTPPKITCKGPDDKTYVDKAATLAAREKYEAIKAEFKSWAYRDEVRRDRLLRIYNDEFNQLVERRYDGSHLVLYGVSSAIEPYKSQLDAIWRLVSGGNTLLAHVVGAGKTFIMVAGAMELRRIGKAQKPLLIVPNHMLEQIAGDFVRFYPTAKVLMASKEDFVGDSRRQFAARIALGDWDAVVMTHATFEKLPMRPETSNRFIRELMEQARLALAMADEHNGKRTVKQCEKLLKALEAKMERAMNDSARDDLVYFDDLGVDHLMVDEAHLFKNLMRVSKMPSIAGLPNVSSNRAFDLWVKTSVIMEQRGGVEQGVTFSTATPIANSIAELHVMMKFLQPQVLKRLGLYEFDAWAATFGEAVQGMEVAPDGSGYRLNTRFSRFVNVPDLMALFRCVADIRTRSMLNLPTPKIKGGKPRTLQSPGNDALKAYTKELVERANKVRSGEVKPNEDNMLAISNCGRKAALDMRLINPALPFDPQGKVAKCRDEVLRVWHETASFKGTQLVFCDLSTPNTAGFSVYHDLKSRLVAGGIPEGEFAFIHDYDTDAAKGKLFKLVRAGAVRVLMGSTLKLGMGTNVQKRLKCCHQLDAPWRPADVEQRDGRAERPGNMCSEIELLRYVTEQSFDAYVWQLLEMKMRFIEQIMTTPTGMRTVEDLSMGALTYAEIKAIASGNPLVLEKATVDADVMRLSVLKGQWEQDRWRWNNSRRHNESVLKAIAHRMSSIELDAEAIEQEMAGGWRFVPHNGWSDPAVGETSLAAKIGAQLHAVSRTMPKFGEAVVGVMGGMQVILSRYDGLEVVIQSRNGPAKYTPSRTGVPIHLYMETGQLVIEKIVDLIQEPARQIQLAQRLEEENRDIQSRLQQGFEHQERFEQLMERQRVIDAELDLDKDEAGAIEATDTSTP